MAMTIKVIDSVSVCAPEGMSRDELAEYVREMKLKYPTLYELDVHPDGEWADLTVQTRAKPFERIRRITGKPDQ